MPNFSIDEEQRYLESFLEMLKTKNIADIKKTIDHNGNTWVIIELPDSDDSKYEEPLFAQWGTLFGYTTKSGGHERFYESINKKLALSDYDIVLISKYDNHPFSIEIRLKEKEKDIETKQSNTGGKKKRSKKRMKSTKKKRHIKKRRYTKKRR